jgi:hypothetical protein
VSAESKWNAANWIQLVIALAFFISIAVSLRSQPDFPEPKPSPYKYGHLPEKPLKTKIVCYEGTPYCVGIVAGGEGAER